MQYTALPQSLNQLTQLLLSKGMLIDDMKEAERNLLNIGYFRFKRYTSPYHIVDNKGNYTFVKATDFYNIKDLYTFDSALRIIVFEAIANIEIAFKSILNYTMTVKHGTHWYLQKNIFDTKFYNSLDPDYLSKYDRFIGDLTKECNDSREHFIRSYYHNYTDPDLPPSWVILEIMSFGTCSILYQNILNTDDRASISKPFNVNQKIFESWLVCMSYIRNQCAHHHKIIDRTFMFPPIIPKKKDNRFLDKCYEIDPRELYAALCIIQYCSLNLNINELFKENLKDLINNNPQVNIIDLGFTADWVKEKIWQ